MYVLSKAKEDDSVPDHIHRIWYTSDDGSSDLILWLENSRDSNQTEKLVRFEFYIRKEGLVWTKEAGSVRNYVDEEKDVV